MPKRILIYFDDVDYAKFETLLVRQEKQTGKRNASELVKRAVFERRDRKKSVSVPVVDLIFLSQLKSKLSSIRGDLKAGREIILSIRELEELAATRLEKI